jgi:hypothetical protein
MRTLILTLALIGLAACKGDKQKCEVACRNVATLLYPRLVEAETATVCGNTMGGGVMAEANSDACQALRKQKLAEFEKRLEDGLPLCINQCTSANNTEQIECMTSAKTATDADKCDEL